MNDALIDEFLNSGRFAVNTRERYRRALKLLLTDFPHCRELSSRELFDWLNRDEWGSNNRSVMLYAIRGFLRHHFGASHPALTLKIKRVKSAPRKALTKKEVNLLLASFDTTTVKGIRDLAMTGVFLDCALRVAEMANLECQYLDIRRKWLTVIVKGGEWDVRTFSDQTAIWLAEWLFVRDSLVIPGQTSVFLSLGGTRKKSGNWISSYGYGLTTEGVKEVVEDWKDATGIENLHGHRFRHTYATLTTRNGAPKSVAMRGGGWHNEDVFEVYVQDLGVEDIQPYLPIKRIMDEF